MHLCTQILGYASHTHTNQYIKYRHPCSLYLKFCFKHRALYIILNTFLTHVNNIHAGALKNLRDVVNEEKLQHKLHVKYAIHNNIFFLKLQFFYIKHLLACLNLFPIVYKEHHQPPLLETTASSKPGNLLTLIRFFG